jgi:superoxide dismutase, Fe-Mn family
MNYKVQEHLKPKALAGISDDQITQHWALYEGYVKNANGLLEATAKAEIGSPAWAETRRRLGFEMNGLVLHEYYFANLASGSKLSPGSDLASEVGAAWGSAGAWREDFAKTGAMRGVGWAILYHDPATGALLNCWI